MKKLLSLLNHLLNRLVHPAEVHASGSAILGQYSYGKKDWPGGSIQGELFDGEVRR